MTVTLQEAQSQLPELLASLTPGDEVVITRDGKPVARLTPELPIGVPIPGRGKGKLTIISDDDEHLNDFAEYM
ncbi:MAG: type II toxin-antitoxin system prevent-host-death family antitoxin [Fimbriiglobus sp.]|jgi:prevent-host-death family protein|nr:type II toxin-antitoxin system prevent-host-death family antitoxin [Fimbriiglobus sp.]